MNEPTFQKIAAELESVLIGQKFGKIFSLARNRFAIDFRLPDSKYLFLSVEPNSPRLYLIKRRFVDLEAQSKNPSGFVQYLRTRLSNAVLEHFEKVAGERILKFTFSARNDVGQIDTYYLIAQFTGRSANLFLLDDRDRILDSCRENRGDGQEIGEIFAPPKRAEIAVDREIQEVFPMGNFESLSESLDNFYFEREVETSFLNLAAAARTKVKSELGKKKRLRKNLINDRNAHGDADEWKRFGDLLLANVATAKRQGPIVAVVDYFDEATPTVEIEIDENDSITGAAEKFFRKYTKSRNAREQIASRLVSVESEIAFFEDQLAKIESATLDKDEDFLSTFVDTKAKTRRSLQKQNQPFNGARKFISSEGIDILVGKRSKDNDFLTFRVAKSLDYWLHAADYPGSHVVVRNPKRIEISQTTLVEAAQIAAFYSRAKSESKVAVHYTQKKFVNKPKGAAPGMVSLASFKTILVEPKISGAEPID